MPREPPKSSSLTLSIISSSFSWSFVSTLRVVGLVGPIGFLVHTSTLDQYTAQQLPGPLLCTMYYGVLLYYWRIFEYIGGFYLHPMDSHWWDVFTLLDRRVL